MKDVTPVEIQEKLEGVEYPANKFQLIKYAEQHGGKNKEVIEALNKLPDKTYNSPVDVGKAMSEII